jgi:hypothetical protein
LFILELRWQIAPIGQIATLVKQVVVAGGGGWWAPPGEYLQMDFY